MDNESASTVDYLIMHSFFEHLFPLYGWPRTLHQKIVTYSCRLPSLIVESQKWMYSLEWHTLGMLHKNMHYEIVNCTLLAGCFWIFSLSFGYVVLYSYYRRWRFRELCET